MAPSPAPIFLAAAMHPPQAAGGAGLLTPSQPYPLQKPETPDTAKLLQRALAGSGSSAMQSLRLNSADQSSHNSSQSLSFTHTTGGQHLDRSSNDGKTVSQGLPPVSRVHQSDRTGLHALSQSTLSHSAHSLSSSIVTCGQHSFAQGTVYQPAVAHAAQVGAIAADLAQKAQPVQAGRMSHVGHNQFDGQPMHAAPVPSSLMPSHANGSEISRLNASAAASTTQMPLHGQADTVLQSTVSQCILQPLQTGAEQNSAQGASASLQIALKVSCYRQAMM